MRRVVVTGLGIVSSIGNNADEVLASLKAGKSGITANGFTDPARPDEKFTMTVSQLRGMRIIFSYD